MTSICLHCGEPIENLLHVPYCSEVCEGDHAQLMMDEADKCEWCGRNDAREGDVICQNCFELQWEGLGA